MKFRYIIIFISLNFLNSQSQNLYPNIGTEIMFQPEWAKKLYYDRIEVFKQDTLRFNQIVYLGFMYVKEEHRGKGVNKRIMNELIEWGKKSGHHIFKLDVYSNNSSAINAYQKAGFKGEELNMIFNLK